MEALREWLASWGLRAWVALVCASLTGMMILTVLVALEYKDDLGVAAGVVVMGACGLLAVVCIFLLDRGMRGSDSTFYSGGLIFALLLPLAWLAFGLVVTPNDPITGLASAGSALFCVYLTLILGLPERARLEAVERGQMRVAMKRRRSTDKESRATRIQRLRMREREVYNETIVKIKQKK